MPRSLACLVLLLALSSAGRAAEPPEPPPATLSDVDNYIDRGTRFFQDHRYDQAAEMLKAAYALDPRPVFLFNIGQAYRRAGHTREALDMYRRFLKEDPRTPLRAEAEGYASELAVLLQEEERLERERRKPLYRKGWFWGVVAASTVAVLGAGLGVGLGVGLRDSRTVVDLSFKQP